MGIDNSGGGGVAPGAVTVWVVAALSIVGQKYHCTSQKRFSFKNLTILKKNFRKMAWMADLQEGETTRNRKVKKSSELSYIYCAVVRNGEIEVDFATKKEKSISSKKR